ncbi:MULTISPECIES: extracellular solute-binding protein [Actinoplanes]|uniref:ABC transporter substrate-binding protein n=1 Tax=Actinoplanes TaxID=1865 RepID=UPI0005F2F65E|nr:MULTISPECIES: extracellular solute-binding protein [Actinoplanes]GLY04448.1 sugar ABC transporter substrate-binding protein [Actinoplanes sp. NBRC 101535]
MSRRNVLRLSLAGAAATLTGCASEETTAAGTPDTVLWTWPGGLSTAVVTAAAEQFASRTRLETRVIEGDYRPQLADLLAQGGDLPGIVGIKGEDIASLLPRADLFADLHDLGADEVTSQYASWKWDQASAPDSRLIGFPIDIGPTATYYRSDLFAAAGLPTGVAELSAKMADWDGFFAAGAQLHDKLPKVGFTRNGAELFTILICQGTQRFVDEGNHYIGAGAHIQESWDLSVRLIDEGLTARIHTEDQDAWQKALADGTVATALGAAWLGYDIKTAAPDTAGKWGVAGGATTGANYGGSFLAIPQAGTGHELSFEIIRWILSPENQAAAFTDAALFPAATAAYDTTALTTADAFFGDQKTVEVFAASARKAHRVYEAPADTEIHQAFVEQLGEYESGRKDRATAWTDAVANGRRVAESMGVN